MKTTALIITALILAIITYSQGVQNYGAQINIEQGAYFFIKEDIGLQGTADYTNLSENSSQGRIDLDGRMIVEGHWTNNAANEVFINIEPSPNGWVELTGAIQQNISGLSPTTFESLLINNISNGGIDIDKQINITDTMLFYDGIVHTDENNVVEFRENSTSTDGSTEQNAANDESYVEGPVRKIGATPFTFPTGGGLGTALFRPIRISGFDGNMQTFTAWYRSNNPSYEGYDINLIEEPRTIENVCNKEYWLLDRSNGSANTIVSLSWNNSYTCEIPSNPQKLRVARWNGSLWENRGNTAVETNPPSWGGWVYSEPLNNFSPFTLAHEFIMMVVPNAISPNSDGHNDELIIEGLENCPDNELVIFNRWGNKIFEASPYSNDDPWYGQSRSHFMKILGGDMVPDGTYYYILKFSGECSDLDILTGYIEVKRY